MLILLSVVWFVLSFVCFGVLEFVYFAYAVSDVYVCCVRLCMFMCCLVWSIVCVLVSLFMFFVYVVYVVYVLVFSRMIANLWCLVCVRVCALVCVFGRVCLLCFMCVCRECCACSRFCVFLLWGSLRYLVCVIVCVCLDVFVLFARFCVCRVCCACSCSLRMIG